MVLELLDALVLQQPIVELPTKLCDRLIPLVQGAVQEENFTISLLR